MPELPAPLVPKALPRLVPVFPETAVAGPALDIHAIIATSPLTVAVPVCPVIGMGTPVPELSTAPITCASCDIEVVGVSDTNVHIQLFDNVNVVSPACCTRELMQPARFDDIEVNPDGTAALGLPLVLNKISCAPVGDPEGTLTEVPDAAKVERTVYVWALPPAPPKNAGPQVNIGLRKSWRPLGSTNPDSWSRCQLARIHRTP